MSESRADEIVRRFEELASERSSWESHWEDIAKRVFLRQAFFTTKGTPGARNTAEMFDATASLALERYAAAIESMLTPRTQRWHGLTVADDELQDNHDIKLYLDTLSSILFRSRYAPRANFASQSHECYMSNGAFGSSTLFITENPGKHLIYRAIHLSETYYSENSSGVIDTVFRKFELTARQAAQEFGYDKLPSRVKDAFDKKKETAKFEFLHLVCPNEEIKPGRKDHKGMPFCSIYTALADKQVISEGGFRTFPYAIGRNVTAPREIYGRSPAMTILPGIKIANAMKRTILKSGEKAVDPPLMLADDGALQPFSLRPGALNYGTLDAEGRELVKPLNAGQYRFDVGLQLLEQERKLINDAFLVTLFQILVDAPSMTATEALIRAQEKGALLAPTGGRLQSEFLGPMIQREIDILARAGALPPIPRSLLEAGVDLIDIEYTSPLSKAQRAEDGVAIMRTLEAVTPLAQFDPSVLRVFDADAIARELGSINGVPQKIYRTPEKLKEMEEQEQAALQAQQLLQAAPIVAQSAKGLMEAQQLAGAIPQAAGAV